MTNQNQTGRGVFYIILSAVIYGCMPLAAKTLYASGVTPISLVFFRNLLALPVLFVIVWMRGRLKIGARMAAKAALAGLLGGTLTPLLLFSSYSFIPSGAATTVHYVYPVFVMLICAVGFRDRITLVKLACLLLSSAGVCMLYLTGASMDVRGFLLAFASGIAFASYTTLIGKSKLNTLDPFQLNLYSCSCSALTLLPVTLLSKPQGIPGEAGVWLLCVVFALMISVGAMSLFKAGTARIGPQNAAILSTFEPITSILVGVLLFHEPFGVTTAIGVACILTAVVLLSVLHERQPKSKGGATA